MKAVVYYKFGPPEVLNIEEVETPIPNDDEVLVKIYAFAVAKEDPGFRSAPGFNGIFKPKNPILGEYLSGVVAGVGKAVSKFKIGDKVYADVGSKYGAYAQFICISENGGLAIMPENMTFEEAAAIPNGYLTALPFLKEKADVKKGDSVLINGASGAVGSAAVRLAKYFGAEVTGVCSKDNIEMVKSLGAEKTIDYREKDFTRDNIKYDIIFDTVGNTDFSKCKNVLKDNGIFITTIPNLSIMIRKLLNKKKGKRTGFGAMGLRKSYVKAKDLVYLTSLANEGNIKAVIDRVYSMEETREAHIYVKQGHKKGNVTIKVTHGN